MHAQGMLTFDIKSHLQHLKQNIKLAENVRIVRETKEISRDMYRMQEKIQQDLKKLKGLKNLKWSEMESILEAYFCLDIPSAYSKQQHPHLLKQLLDYLNGGYCREDATQMFEFLHGKTTLSEPASTYQVFQEHKVQQLQKQYALETYQQQRKLHLALVYEGLSKELMEKSEELRIMLTTEDRMSMNEGERTQALAEVHALSLRAIDMKARANQLLAEAQQKGPVQSVADELHYRKLRSIREGQQLESLLGAYSTAKS